MKRKLDLRTGTPVWSAYRAPAVFVAKLARDIRTDMLVMGMGISGAMIAEALTAAGQSVVCIDRRGPLRLDLRDDGSCPVRDRPAAVAAFGKIGSDRAERAWRRSRLSISISTRASTNSPSGCNMAPRPSLFSPAMCCRPAACGREAEMRRHARASMRPTCRASVLEQFGMDRDGRDPVSHDNIALDPRKLTAGLMRRARGKQGAASTPRSRPPLSRTARMVSPWRRKTGRCPPPASRAGDRL